MDRVKLNEINIDAACNEADAYLESKKAERSERLRTRLALEEILLQYKSAFGSDAEFTVDYSGGIAKCRIRLTVPGEQAALLVVAAVVGGECGKGIHRYILLSTIK